MEITTQKGYVLNISADVAIIFVSEIQKWQQNDIVSFMKGISNERAKIYSRQIIQEFFRQDFTGKENQTCMIDLFPHEQNKISHLCIVGLGEKKRMTIETVRRAAAEGIMCCKREGLKSVAVDATTVSSHLHALFVAQAIVEGAKLTSYTFLKYRKEEGKKSQKRAITHLIMVSNNASILQEYANGITRGQQFADATLMVRDMVNEPASEMKPKHLVECAQKIANNPNITVTIFDEQQLQKMGMGALCAVSAGSDETAYLIHLAYRPKIKNKKPLKRLVLCGKGITFDSGGLSLKPPQYMEAMKMDMAGAANILGVFSEISNINPLLEVHGVIATTENMPSGKASRPGDIVTAYNGTTIEIVNTDAEGRLVLADALSWAEKKLSPDYMIDIATLTGSAIIALGQEVAAMLGTSPLLTNIIKRAAENSGEQFWELPLISEYEHLLESKFADIQNIATVRWADTIMGAMFLKRFVKKTPWIHLDIAGPAWVERQVLPYATFGATGFGTRTLLQCIMNLSSDAK